MWSLRRLRARPRRALTDQCSSTFRIIADETNLIVDGRPVFNPSRISVDTSRDFTRGTERGMKAYR